MIVHYRVGVNPLEILKQQQVVVDTLVEFVKLEFHFAFSELSFGSFPRKLGANKSVIVASRSVTSCNEWLDVNPVFLVDTVLRIPNGLRSSTHYTWFGVVSPVSLFVSFSSTIYVLLVPGRQL
jgi:hypothetical protein